MTPTNDRIIDEFGQVHSLNEETKPVKIGSPTIKKHKNKTQEALIQLKSFVSPEKPAEVQQSQPEVAKPESSQTAAARTLTSASRQTYLAQQLTKPVPAKAVKSEEKPVETVSAPQAEPGYELVRIPVYDEKGQLISYQQIKRLIEPAKPKTPEAPTVMVPVYDEDGNIVSYQQVAKAETAAPKAKTAESKPAAKKTKYRNHGTAPEKKPAAQPKTEEKTPVKQSKTKESPKPENKPVEAAKPAVKETVKEPERKPQPQPEVKPAEKPAADQPVRNPAPVAAPAVVKPAAMPAPVSVKPADKPAVRPKAAEEQDGGLKWYFKLVLLLDVLVILAVATVYLPFSPLRKNLIISSLSHKSTYYIAYALYTPDMIQETVNEYLGIDE
ncbi:MAG: hypothetical protein K6A14_07800 [Erysipelotrichaceae bacterium]|nr:hypothetical protein [Erysipelotrichaceae bacterium]